MERWRPIPGFEGYYAVSDDGRFRSLSRTIVDRNGLSKRITGRIMRPSRSHGYVSFVLWKDHRQTTMRAHQVAAIRKRRASHSQEALAREFGISQAQVSRIMSGQHWRGAALGTA